MRWHVPDSPFEREPTIEALLALADGTPVAYEGTFAAAAQRDVLERRLGAHRDRRRVRRWTGGVQNPFRGTVTLSVTGRRRAV